MLRYADYEYYVDPVNGYGGSKADETAFADWIGHASAFIARETFGRISGDPPDEVKQAACALVDCLYDWGGVDGVASESVGEFSVTYNTGHGGHAESVRSRMYELLRDYLGNTGLLYRGLD
jgi:hypothetical protein